MVIPFVRCLRYDRQHPMFVFYLVTDKVVLLIPMKLYLNDLVIRCAALQAQHINPLHG